MRALVMVLAAFLGLLGGISARAADKPLIGLSMNVPEGGGAKELGQAILAARADGAGIMYLSAKWSDLEPKPGEYQFKDLDGAIPPLTALGFKISITIQTLDTNNRTLPPDLKDAAFDSLALRQRFHSLLGQIAPKLTPGVVSVSLGNEADVYLKDHPQELEPFAGFVEDGRTYLRTLKPGLAISVTTTFDGLRDHPELFRRLNRNMDVITMTYYPLAGDFMVRPVADVSSDFDSMARAAGDKPLRLQEIGYPADGLLNSSEDKQAAFINAVFDAVQKHSDKIASANYFLLCDFNRAFLDQLETYYHLPDPKFRAFLGTLGLKKADNTPRKSWGRFEARLHAWTANSAPKVTAP